MSGDADDPLLSVAGKISNGTPVDWQELQDQIATPDQAAVVEELRTLERFARVNEAIPASWGRFQILERIGFGAFGVVYRAFDPQMQIEVALKVTRLRGPHAASDWDKGFEETRRLAKIAHPNVVRVLGVERIGDEVGLFMEYVHGRTLQDIVSKQGPFGANEAVLIGIDLCRAIAAVHGSGMLHGDIKAQNVMREDKGRLVLMDFGTGRYMKQQPAGPGADFAGTPLYLAREIFAGNSRTVASEIYSLGVLLYFLVTGSHPIQGETLTVIRQLHDQGGARKPLRDARPDLPDQFVRVVERALADDPGQRFQSAGALETALAQLLPEPGTHHDPSPSPTLKVLLAVVAVLVLAVASYTVSRLRAHSTVTESAGATVLAPTVTVASAASTLKAGEYQIDAAFYREQSGSVERLRPGTRVAPDEALSLQVEVSAPAYVYVVNEDESGESYLLFPLPGLALTNPLPPGQRHRLPGMWNGESVSWQITSAGKLEHFLIVASPQRSREFEEMFATLPQPSFGKTPARKLSEEEIGVLRSVSGLVASPARSDQQLRLLPQFATPLAAAEERVSGVWIRHVTFENPN